MTKRLTEKLSSTAGFTLAEQLVSVVFVGLLCIAIGAGLAAAMGASNAIAEASHTQQLLARSSQVITDEFSFALSAPVDVGGEITYVSGSARMEVQIITLMKDGVPQGIGLTGKDVSQGTDAPDELLLVPASNDLVPIISAVSYDSSTKLWSCDLEIVKTGDTGGQPLASVALQVKRVGN